MDRPPIPKSFPNETPSEFRDKVIAVSIQHPAWGPMKISDQLRLENVNVSPGTVRNMGRRPIETIEAGKVIKEQVTKKQAA